MPASSAFFRSIRPRGVLSFGPQTAEIELQSLNVLIGPNGSGKSNLIDVVAFMCATQGDLAQFVREGGGVQEWLWKGATPTVTGEIEATIHHLASMQLRHRVAFTLVGQSMHLVEEDIEEAWPRPPGDAAPHPYYEFANGRAGIEVRDQDEGFPRRNLRLYDLAYDQSILSQRKDPNSYPELSYLSSSYARFRAYREWKFGRNTDARRPQPTDLPTDFLLENAANLGLVLNKLERQPGAGLEIRRRLERFDERFRGIHLSIEGNTIQIFLHEGAMQGPIPATRLSDGTLRYLMLLAILCHPNPPPVICIEEPEVGLHPDIIPDLAELLVEASARTQLFVTTHSDHLVDCFTDTPEAILVTEKSASGTRFQRLSKSALKEWLERYSLGELWTKGELGGNRW